MQADRAESESKMRGTAHRACKPYRTPMARPWFPSPPVPRKKETIQTSFRRPRYRWNSMDRCHPCGASLPRIIWHRCLVHQHLDCGCSDTGNCCSVVRGCSVCRGQIQLGVCRSTSAISYSSQWRTGVAGQEAGRLGEAGGAENHGDTKKGGDESALLRVSEGPFSFYRGGTNALM